MARRRDDRGSMLLQVALATAVAGAGVAAVADTAAPTLGAARAWACEASAAAAETALVAHLARGGTWPVHLQRLVDGPDPLLVLTDAVSVAPGGRALAGDGWTVNVEPTGTASCTVGDTPS